MRLPLRLFLHAGFAIITAFAIAFGASAGVIPAPILLHPLSGELVLATADGLRALGLAGVRGLALAPAGRPGIERPAALRATGL